MSPARLRALTLVLSFSVALLPGRADQHSASGRSSVKELTNSSPSAQRLQNACGIECLYLVLKFLNFDTSLSRLLEEAPAFDKDGVSVSTLESLLLSRLQGKFDVKMSGRVDVRQVSEMLGRCSAAVLFVSPRTSDQLGHYVAVIPSKDGYKILDPSRKEPLSKEFLDSSTSYVALLLVEKGQGVFRPSMKQILGWGFIFLGMVGLVSQWRQRRSKDRSGLIQATTSLVLLVSMFLGTGCSKQNEMPKLIRMEPATVDLGVINPAIQQETKAIFYIANDTDEKVRVLGYQPSCSCVRIPKLPEVLLPGQKTSFEVLMVPPIRKVEDYRANIAIELGKEEGGSRGPIMATVSCSLRPTIWPLTSKLNLTLEGTASETDAIVSLVAAERSYLEKPISLVPVGQSDLRFSLGKPQEITGSDQAGWQSDYPLNVKWLRKMDVASDIASFDVVVGSENRPISFVCEVRRPLGSRFLPDTLYLADGDDFGRQRTVVLHYNSKKKPMFGSLGPISLEGVREIGPTQLEVAFKLLGTGLTAEVPTIVASCDNVEIARFCVRPKPRLQ